MIPVSTPLALTAISLPSELLAAPDDEPSRSLWLLAALVCLCVAILASVASTSLLLYSPAKLTRNLNGGSEERLAEVNAYRAAYHALAKTLALIAIIGAGLLVWEGSTPTSRPWLLAAYAIVTVLGCGLLPGAIAASHAERVVGRVVKLPAAAPLVAAANHALRALRIQRRSDDPDKVVEDILAAVEDNVSEAGLASDERSWIENIVDLKDTQASEIMTPRTDIVAFDKDMPLLEAVAQATEAGYSRFPVYEGKVDHVVGVFYAKDMLPLLGKDQPGADVKVAEYMRKPVFVPESIGLAELLRQFRTSRVQMAIVLDEYGGTDGLVTIEDVLEEIVGDITDEYDPDEHPRIDVIEEGRVIETSGRVRIEEINEALHVEIPEAEDYDTVAGYVFTSLDRIPKVDEVVALEGVEIEVLDADDRRIHRLRLTVPAAKLEA